MDFHFWMEGFVEHLGQVYLQPRMTHSATLWKPVKLWSGLWHLVTNRRWEFTVCQGKKKKKKEKPHVEALNCLGAARVPPPGHSQSAAHLKTSHHGRSDMLPVETLHSETVSKILPALRSDAIMETLNCAGGRVFFHSSKFLKTCLSCFEWSTLLQRETTDKINTQW